MMHKNACKYKVFCTNFSEPDTFLQVPLAALALLSPTVKRAIVKAIEHQKADGREEPEKKKTARGPQKKTEKNPKPAKVNFFELFEFLCSKPHIFM